MKKFVIALVFTSLFSLSVIAGDGSIPTGGKTCPPNQTCFTGDDGTTHTGGKSLIQTEEDSADAIYKEIFNYLKFLFE